MIEQRVENRRNAVRVTHGGTGRLEAGSLRVQCRVVDLSVGGAKLQMLGMHLLPDRVTLVTRVAGERVALAATIVRAEPGKPGPVIALQFDNGDGAGLGRLINEVQRVDMASAQPPLPAGPPPRPRPTLAPAYERRRLHQPDGGPDRPAA